MTEVCGTCCFPHAGAWRTHLPLLYTGTQNDLLPRMLPHTLRERIAQEAFTPISIYNWGEAAGAKASEVSTMAPLDGAGPVLRDVLVTDQMALHLQPCL